MQGYQLQSFVSTLVTCTILHTPAAGRRDSSRPLYPYFVVAPTEHGPVLSPVCVSVSLRRSRQVSIVLYCYPVGDFGPFHIGKIEEP